MKIFAVNGSPRHDGNTFEALSTVLQVCAESGFETELFQAGGRVVRGCTACNFCASNIGQCAHDDWMIEVYAKMKAADAIILGSPVYFADLTPELKSIIDRCGYISRRDGHSLARKVGAGVAAVRRAGGIHTLDSIQHFFLINEMIIPGSSYWNMSLSRAKGDFEKDEEGVGIMRRLGENIVWLLKKIN